MLEFFDDEKIVSLKKTALKGKKLFILICMNRL